jgi:hypothetical protein
MKRHVLNVSDVDTYASDMAAQSNCDHHHNEIPAGGIVAFHRRLI